MKCIMRLLLACGPAANVTFERHITGLIAAQASLGMNWEPLPDASGIYTVLLGANSTNGVPAELFASGEARWLEVLVERQAEQPRVLLVGVPYALKAADAETLGGRPLSAFQLVPSNPNGTASNNASPNGAQPAAGEEANEIVCSSSTACKTGFVPLFTSNRGSATVSNSLISQTGTTVAVSGTETVTGSLGLPKTTSPSVGVLTQKSMSTAA